jgi:hypothetical protein
MNDGDRVRLATPSGDKMLGPIERERCGKHRRRWVLYRWVWDAGEGGDISGGEPQVMRSCAECLAEDQASEFNP